MGREDEVTMFPLINGRETAPVDYKDTEQYIVTKRFMDAPEKMVEELLG